MEKIAALSCSLLAILTTTKNKLNHFRNFSESTHFPEAKLEAEFTQILKFLNITISFWGKLYVGHECSRYARQNLKTSKSGHFEVSAKKTKKAPGS